MFLDSYTTAAGETFKYGAETIKTKVMNEVNKRKRMIALQLKEWGEY